jgi:hypothetical protein
MTKIRKSRIKVSPRNFYSTKKVQADPVTTTAFATQAVSSVIGTNMAILVGLSIAIIMSIAHARGYPLDIPISPSTDGSGDTNMPDDTPDIVIPIALINEIQRANGIMDLYLLILNNVKESLITALPFLSTSVLQSTLENLEILIRLHEYIFQYLARYLNEYADLLGDIEPYLEMENTHELWRTQGNGLMEIFRQIEELLHVPIENSTLGVQWFED